MQRFIRHAVLCCLWLVSLSAVAGAAPNITNVSPRGLQIGAVTTITVDGQGLAAGPQLVMPLAIEQKLLDGATNTRAQFEIKLPADVSPGIYQLRLANADGISNPLAIGVDALPQLPLASQAESLPVALHGNLSGNNVLSFSFTGKKGQPIVADVECRRLGGNFNPVVRIIDERDTQLAWSPPLSSIAGDARCQLQLPADGRYTVMLHDELYRAGGPGFFRLKVGELKFADRTMPLGAQAGKAASLRYAISNFPEAATATAQFDARGGTIQPAPWSKSGPVTGLRPPVAVSPHEEVTEAGDASPQAVPAPPVGISGRLAAPDERDRYLLPVAPGAKLNIQVYANRVGSPIDGVLDVLDESGRRIAGNDDQGDTTDPGLNFDVPGNVNKVVIALRDLSGRGTDDSLYRIEIRERTRPDFHLSIASDRINVAPGGTTIVKLTAARQNYTGPIDLEVLDLPSGVAVAGTQIAAGSNIGLLSFTAGESAQPVAGLIRIVGRTADNASVVRLATASETQVTRAQPWLASELALAVTRPAPLQLVWAGGAGPFVQGTKLPSEVQVKRAENVQGDVRLSLVVPQEMPKKTIKDPKTKKDQVVNDLARALRLDGKPAIAQAETAATVNVHVPPDLPVRAWEVAIKAELLSGDKKTVLATAFSPLRKFEVVNPLSLQLSGSADLEAKAGGGDTGTLSGTIARRDGFAHPVTVTLDGLPKGYPPPAVVIPPDKNDFALAVRFPYGTKPAELKNIQLVATVATDPKNADVLVRSNSAAVNIQVVPGEKTEEKK